MLKIILKSRYFKILFIIICSSSLSACVYIPSQNAQSIQEIHELPHKDCELLGQVIGESSYSLLAVGLEISKNRAKIEAHKLGATHVVWAELNYGLTPFAIARAYRCQVLPSRHLKK